ncbi:MAG: hypothetical protein Q7T11_03685 [Deltaproteobacteria bacterium]|nr:hypothetical protein [Deltaproteobacteria bacterium]
MKNTILAGVLVVLSACGSSSSDESADEEVDESADTATLSSIQSDIFTPNCALSGCHSSTSAQAGLSLADGDSFSNLVGEDSTQASGLKRVLAGDPDNSYLIHKLEGTQAAAGGSGSDMPKNASALSQEDIDQIREWITNGAENN